MAKAEQIKALFRCHAEGDETRCAVAMQVAAQARLRAAEVGRFELGGMRGGGWTK